MRLLSVFMVCFAVFLAGCDNKDVKQNYFQYIKTLFSDKENKIICGDNVLFVHDVTPMELRKHIPFLESKGFHEWNYLETSEGFLLLKDQLTVFTGEKGKSISYSVSGVQRGRYTPVILLDEKAMILYCVFSTGLGG